MNMMNLFRGTKEKDRAGRYPFTRFGRVARGGSG
jgi:hypothetical protein